MTAGVKIGGLFSVDGLVVAITGAASGMGLAFAEAFAANGSHEAPRPSMLMAIWRSANSPVNFSEVNCDPWSLLKISGRPRCNARFRARMRNIRAPHLLTRSTVVPRNKYG